MYNVGLIYMKKYPFLSWDNYQDAIYTERKLTEKGFYSKQIMHTPKQMISIKIKTRSHRPLSQRFC